METEKAQQKQGKVMFAIETSNIKEVNVLLNSGWEFWGTVRKEKTDVYLLVIDHYPDEQLLHQIRQWCSLKI